MLLEVISPTFEAYFARVARATPSIKSPRLFMGKTFHSTNGLTPQHSLRAPDVRISNATGRKTKALHEPAGALLIDEFSQLQVKLFHANISFWTVARQHTYDLKVRD